MLTLKDVGKPIAIIHGGIDDGEIISIIDDSKKITKYMDTPNHGGMRNYLDYDSEDDYSDDDYDDDDINDTEYEVEDGGILVPLPSMDTRQVTYIAGPSGSGKSTYASVQAEKYRKIFPGQQIYIFSRLDQDPAFDNKFNPPIIRMKIDENLIKHPIDIAKQLKGGCLVIFDDIDTIQDDKLKKAVLKLENDILEIGRHNNIYIIACCHLINSNDKKFSRTILNEANTITVFPKSGCSYQIEYLLKKYFGMTEKKAKELLASVDSRWITLFKGYPQTICWEHGCKLLN